MVKGRVGIVLVNYNAEAFIVDCVNSLLDQTYKDIEIIIWDNNSQDDSVRIIKQNYPSIRLVENKQNDGFAKANNLAVKELLKGDAEMLKHLEESTDIVKSNRKLILAVIANIGVFLVCLLTAALLPDSVLAIACVFCLAVAGVACLLYQIVKRI